MKYITIEQAVEAVGSYIETCAKYHTAPNRDGAAVALRAIQPQEVSEDEVEMVAVAIYAEDEVMECLTPESRVPWDALTDDWRNHWRTVARAAIAAMKRDGGKER